MISLKPLVLSAALLAPALGCVPLDSTDTEVAEGALTSTATRPLLTSTQAAGFTVRALSRSGTCKRG